MPQVAVNCALALWAAAAAGIDLRFKRVPNALLLLLLVPALSVLALSGSGLLGAGPLQSLVGLLVAGVPLLPGYALGQLGAGDVKAAGSLGLLLGGAGALEMLLVACVLLGGASAVILALRRSGRALQHGRIPALPAFAAAFVLQLFAGRLLL